MYPTATTKEIRQFLFDFVSIEISKLHNPRGINDQDGPATHSRVRKAVNIALQQLESQNEYLIELEAITCKKDEPLDLSIIITREILAEIILKCRLFDHFANEFHEEHGFEIRSDRMASIRIKVEMDEVYSALSLGRDATLSLPFISARESGPVHFRATLNVDEFHRIATHYPLGLVELSAATAPLLLPSPEDFREQ